MWQQTVAIGGAITGDGTSWFAAGLAAMVACAAAVGFRRTRRSTLAAPAAWCVAAALAIAGTEGWLAWKAPGVAPLSASLLRYAAAVGVFCPIMAVLGAKRPQDLGWQWVVATLWAILLVPALQAIAARSGEWLELFGAWRMMLAGLMAMTLLNYLPTRYALAACLTASGQLGLLAPYLLGANEAAGAWRVAGLASLLAALLVAALLSRRRTAATRNETHELERMDRRWFAFRDGWGAFWALRVLQCVNQSAELGGWPVRLEWSGFAPVQETQAGELLDPSLLRRVDETLDALLWRFERRASAAPEEAGAAR